MPLARDLLQAASRSGLIICNDRAAAADVYFRLLIGDLQVHRVIGAMNELPPSETERRASEAVTLPPNSTRPTAACVHCHPPMRDLQNDALLYGVFSPVAAVERRNLRLLYAWVCSTMWGLTGRQSVDALHIKTEGACSDFGRSRCGWSGCDPVSSRDWGKAGGRRPDGSVRRGASLSGRGARYHRDTCERRV
ncbi:TetR/AcrR family transcriptional regulator C-terminal domain-containing protein [Agrobacterium arsenijevicii]|uniref:TetR/AcrR family transcriptional regulator C-terminal domain-containing protein n=1 Tax=Agrobacterium arsenijevicii TaxID=1585697 RepID=UPI003305FD00